MQPLPRFILIKKKASANCSHGVAVEELFLLTRGRNANANASNVLSLPQSPVRRLLSSPWLIFALGSLMSCSDNHCVALRWQGIRYDVVEMGEQCWFADNLHVEADRNGEMITYAEADDVWRRATQGIRCHYDHDATLSAPTDNSKSAMLSSMSVGLVL